MQFTFGLKPSMWRMKHTDSQMQAPLAQNQLIRALPRCFSPFVWISELAGFYETVELPQDFNEEKSVRHKQPWKLRGRKCHPESLAQGLVRPGFWQTLVSESINEEAKRSTHNTFDFDPLLKGPQLPISSRDSRYKRHPMHCFSRTQADPANWKPVNLLVPMKLWNCREI